MEDKRNLQLLPLRALKIGMFILSDVYGKDGQLLFQKNTTITSNEQLINIKNAVSRYVTVDLGQSKDVDPDELKAMLKSQDKKDLGEKIPDEDQKQPPLEAKKTRVINPIPLRQELRNARNTYKQAVQQAKQVVQSLSQEGSVNFTKVTNTVEILSSSLFNNDNALNIITKLKSFHEYTFIHSVDVCILSLSIGKRLLFSKEDLISLGTAALLHDIGKTRIAKEIIDKTSQLDDKDWEEVTKHPIYSAEILKKSGEFDSSIIKSVEQHHECCNGSGYPYALKGNQIHKFASIIGLADTYDAMIAKRSYKESMLPSSVVQKLADDKALYDNPSCEGIIEKFIAVVGIYPVGSFILLSSDELAIITEIDQQDLSAPKVMIIYDSDRNDLRSEKHEVSLKDYQLEKRFGSIMKKEPVHIEKVLDPSEWDINPFVLMDIPAE